LGHDRKWTKDQHARFATLSTSPIGQQIRVLRAFMEGWYRLWRNEDGSRPSEAACRERFEAWSAKQEFDEDKVLRAALKRLAGKFEQLVPFLRNPLWQSTNNAAERTGRAFRRWQRSHYRLRSTASIERPLQLRSAPQQQPVISVGRCVKGRSIRIDSS